MRTIHFFSVLIVGAVALCSCGKTSDTPTQVVDPPPVTSIGKDLAFAKQDIQITADVDRRYTDRDIILTMKCLPLVSGVGRIRVFGEGNTQYWSWRVVSPMIDTIASLPSGNDLAWPDVQANFTANDTCTIIWRIRLDSPVTYTFTAFARIDSVAVPGLDHLVTPWSTEAKIMSRNKMGYEEAVESWNSLYLR